MGLRTSESVLVPAPVAEVFPVVAELDRYPAWLGLVHRADPLGGDPPAWSVELRARIGPFARSKQLRMARTGLEQDAFVQFERREQDGRQHARWNLRVELRASGAHDDPGAATELTMHLSYDGALWTGGVLERALDDEIRRGRAALVRLVSGGPTH